MAIGCDYTIGTYLAVIPFETILNRCHNMCGQTIALNIGNFLVHF